MKIVEHPDLSRLVFGLAAAEYIKQSAGTESDESSDVQEKLAAIGREFAGVGNTAFLPIDESYIRLTVPQGVGESFGYNLSTSDGHRLWLIDHEKLVLSEVAEDIAALHEIIQHYSPGLDACRQISQITEADIMKSLAGISYQFWQQDCAFNNEEDAGEYYKLRLCVWKNVFGAVPQN